MIQNCKIVNVFSGKIVEGNIAICGDQIAGIGDYEGKEVIDAGGRYAAPGFIDSHIHIESAYVSPEEIGRLLVPHGEQRSLRIRMRLSMSAESEGWII